MTRAESQGLTALSESWTDTSCDSNKVRRPKLARSTRYNKRVRPRNCYRRGKSLLTEAWLVILVHDGGS
jgi:hypothetical protein